MVVYYVYKDPVISWDFTKKREKIDGRNIPKKSFINQYFGAMEVINLLKSNYGNKIQVDLVQLSSLCADSPQITDYKFKFNIGNVDGHIKEVYSKNKLQEIL